jgi:hypothetical protein
LVGWMVKETSLKNPRNVMSAAGETGKKQLRLKEEEKNRSCLSRTREVIRREWKLVGEDRKRRTFHLGAGEGVIYKIPVGVLLTNPSIHSPELRG